MFIGIIIAVIVTHIQVVHPLRISLEKAESDLELIESRGVVLRGLDDRCHDWKIRIDCRDETQAGWDFLYVDKKGKYEKAK